MPGASRLRPSSAAVGIHAGEAGLGSGNFTCRLRRVYIPYRAEPVPTPARLRKQRQMLDAQRDCAGGSRLFRADRTTRWWLEIANVGEMAAAVPVGGFRSSTSIR